MILTYLSPLSRNELSIFIIVLPIPIPILRLFLKSIAILWFTTTTTFVKTVQAHLKKIHSFAYSPAL